MLYTKELAEQLQQAIEWIDIKASEDEAYSFEVIATNANQDRDGEVITLEGRDYKNYMKNPVILANHDYTIESIIGKATKVLKKDGNLVIRWVFSKSNPLAELARQLYNEGMLKTVSVWFIPTQRSQSDRKIIEKAELLELSFVAVPCNPTALSLDEKLFDEAVAKGLIIKDVEEQTEPEAEPEVEETGCSCCKELSTHIKELVNDIKVIKSFIADGKAIEQEQEELLAKKEDLQAVARAVGTALSKLKSLS
jgi:hypothetical protein